MVNAHSSSIWLKNPFPSVSNFLNTAGKSVYPFSLSAYFKLILRFSASITFASFNSFLISFYPGFFSNFIELWVFSSKPCMHLRTSSSFIEDSWLIAVCFLKFCSFGSAFLSPLRFIKYCTISSCWFLTASKRQEFFSQNVFAPL